MNIKELRVGNYIGNGLSYDSDPEFPLGFWHRVRSIGNEEQEFEQIETETEESFEWIFRDNWCGIPLTEEWMIALGFLKTKDKWGNCYHIMEDNGFVCMFSVEHWTDVKEDSKWKNHWHVKGLLKGHKLKYVHQLQNLYFALTGEELEIKTENEAD